MKGRKTVKVLSGYFVLLECSDRRSGIVFHGNSVCTVDMTPEITEKNIVGVDVPGIGVSADTAVSPCISARGPAPAEQHSSNLNRAAPR